MSAGGRKISNKYRAELNGEVERASSQQVVPGPTKAASTR